MRWAGKRRALLADDLGRDCHREDRGRDAGRQRRGI
jgi:hypothetical protein